jgi:hypothetical protein
MPRYPKYSSYLNKRLRGIKEIREEPLRANAAAKKILENKAVRISNIVGCYFCRKATAKSLENLYLNKTLNPPTLVHACIACSVDASRRAKMRKRYGIL